MYTCRQYHCDTGYSRHAMAPHGLDWANQPSVFKQYRTGQTFELERPAGDVPRVSLWQAAAAAPGLRPVDALTRRDLSRILWPGYSLTARSRHPGGAFYYRSVASAGALYPTELYVALADCRDLPAGLYHYDIAAFRLIRLRSENPVPAAAVAVPAWRKRPPAAAFFISGIFFRSAWKYRRRAYRYVLLDAGHLLANLILAAGAIGAAAQPTADFDDAVLAALLGVDGRREAALAAVALPGENSAAPTDRPERVAPLPDAYLDASQVSQKETAYPEIEAVHAAGEAVLPATARSGDMRTAMGLQPAVWQAFGPAQADGGEADLTAAFLKRRSKRNYVRQALPRQRFYSLLELVWRAQQRDMAGRPSSALGAVGFLIGGVQGLEAGFYVLDHARRRYGLLRAGRLVAKMAAVCLDQQWLAQAAVHFLLMADLAFLDRRFGARGYRYAMLSAGALGQVVYLGATALGLGACGIGALYDDEARALLGLGDRSALLYLVAAGPVKRL